MRIELHMVITTVVTITTIITRALFLMEDTHFASLVKMNILEQNNAPRR